MADSYRRVRLTAELLQEAQARASSLPVFEYSHRKREANLVGCLGEVLFERLLTHHGIAFQDCREGTRHDYVVSGLTIDVKTKDRTVPPRKHFDNSVPLYNHEHQRPDFYYFVSLYRDPGADESRADRFKEGYLLGGIALAALEAKGKRWEAGQVDPANGTKFWTACINVGVSLLLSNTEFLAMLGRGSHREHR